MKISQAASLLGLDEVASVRPVPLTDEMIEAMQPARAPQPSTTTPRRRARRAINESRSR